MSLASAAISGDKGSSFIAMISSGTIIQATISAIGTPVTPIPIGTDKRSVTISNLLAGVSNITLTLTWNPGEPNATIGVGQVISGKAQSSVPAKIIFDDYPVGIIELFGV